MTEQLTLIVDKNRAIRFVKENYKRKATDVCYGYKWFFDLFWVFFFKSSQSIILVNTLLLDYFKIHFCFIVTAKLCYSTSHFFFAVTTAICYTVFSKVRFWISNTLYDTEVRLFIIVIIIVFISSRYCCVLPTAVGKRM